MRPDMSKVIVERPRVGGCKSPARNLKIQVGVTDLEEFDGGPRRMTPFKQALRDFGWNTKESTDLIGPLRRFLYKNVGRPWNDIYSEVCQHADNRGVVGSHLRDHVKSEVDFPSCKNGVLFINYGYEFSTESTYKIPLYVDPRDGILKKGTLTPRKKREPKVRILSSNGKFYHQHDGIWYRVEMKECEKYPDAKDAFLGEIVGETHNLWRSYQYVGSPQDKYGKSPKGMKWYCVRKEAANSREIRRLLKNKSYQRAL